MTIFVWLSSHSFSFCDGEDSSIPSRTIAQIHWTILKWRILAIEVNLTTVKVVNGLKDLHFLSNAKNCLALNKNRGVRVMFFSYPQIFVPHFLGVRPRIPVFTSSRFLGVSARDRVSI